MFMKNISNFFTSPRGIYILCWCIFVPLSFLIAVTIDSPLSLLFLAVPFAFMGYLVFNKRLHWNVLQQWGILNLLFISNIVLTLTVCWIISGSSVLPKTEEMSWFEYIVSSSFSCEILDHWMIPTLVFPVLYILFFILGHSVKVFVKSEVTITISKQTKWLFLTGWLCFIPYLVLIIHIIDECGMD